jgi:transposase
MSNVQSTQSPAVLVAIDIAKLRHDVLIEAPGWKRRKRLVLLNTAVEFRRLADYLHSLQMPVRIAFEATGNYPTTTGLWLISCSAKAFTWS